MLRRRVSSHYDHVGREPSTPTARLSRRSRIACNVINVALVFFGSMAFISLIMTTSVPDVLLRDPSKPWQGALVRGSGELFPKSLYASSELRGGSCEVHPPADIDWKFVLGWKTPPQAICNADAGNVARFTAHGTLELDHDKCSGGITIQTKAFDEISIPSSAVQIDVHDYEQVIVKCVNTVNDRSSVTYDILTRIVRNATHDMFLRQQRKQHVAAHRRAPHLNLLLIMVDSLSREHALRSLPLTLDFLSSRPRSQFLDFTRFNTIGRGTKHNFSPVFFGKSGSEFADEEPDDLRIPTLLSMFEERGFDTAYAEEDCADSEGSMGRILGRKAFEDYDESDLKQFKAQVEQLAPHTFANIFCRIMPSMGVGSFFGEATRDRLCFAGDFIHNHVLSYLRQFLGSTDRQTAGSIIVWQNNVAHEASYTRIASLDRGLSENLAEITASVDDVAIIVMGDHGLGYGDIADSATLQFEYDLPSLFMSLPASFTERLPPSSLSNLIANQRKLVTGMDLHATLLDMADLDSAGSPSESGMSFLGDLPDRSCSEIGIPASRCSCATFARENLDGMVWKSVAHNLVNELVGATSSFPECLPLQLKSVKEVRRISETEGDVGTEYEVDVLVGTQQRPAIVENFVFSLSKLPYWISMTAPSTFQPVKRFFVGTKFDTETRLFEDDGIVFGIPSSIWMVFQWETLPTAKPEDPKRVLEAILSNSTGHAQATFTLYVTADWDTSWHERDFDGFALGNYTIKLRDVASDTDLALAEITFLPKPTTTVAMANPTFDRYWKISNTMRRSPFAPYMACMPRGAPTDKCICDIPPTN